MESFDQDEKIVIIDSGMTELFNNKIFIPELAGKISHTILPMCFLYQEALTRGIKLVTPDVYLASATKPGKALMITYLKTSDTEKLIESGARPIIFACQESPFVATRFYISLRRYTKPFKHALVFSGMAKLVSRKSLYHQVYFPNSYHFNDFNPKSFQDKKLLVLVAGAKFSGSQKRILLIDFLYKIRKFVPKKLLASIFGARSMSAWLNKLIIRFFYGSAVKDVFFARRKAINYLAQKNDFDLYGHGWDKINYKDPDYSVIKKVWRGAVDNKFETLRNYKFTLCFENAVFPGYITEKIFDAIFAGSVPIYYGAPDIKAHIPEAAFIDFRDFKNYDELYEYISNMDEEKYSKYLEAMSQFIQSEACHKFSQEYYAEEILKILNREFNNLQVNQN